MTYNEKIYIGKAYLFFHLDVAVLVNCFTFPLSSFPSAVHFGHVTKIICMKLNYTRLSGCYVAYPLDNKIYFWTNLKC